MAINPFQVAITAAFYCLLLHQNYCPWTIITYVREECFYSWTVMSWPRLIFLRVNILGHQVASYNYYSAGQPNIWDAVHHALYINDLHNK